MADDAARAERQARLSKALSAAYLSHQIEQLEDRVTTNLNLGNRGRGRGRRGRRPQGQNQREGQRDVARKPAVEEPIEETRLVLDTSALLFALSAVTHLLRSGRAELIVPLETLRTLDLLKKGMHPYAVAARAATRFVETEQRRTQAHKGEGEVGDDGWRKLRPGLWIQRDNEQEHIAERTQAVDSIPVPPPFIQSTLACGLYFRNFWDLISSQPVFGIAIPPETEVPAEDPVARYADRADGRALREWADRGDVTVRLFGERVDDSQSDEEAAYKESGNAPAQDGFVDQEEGRIMTLTSPSDDPRVRQRRQPARTPPPPSDRVPKIFDAEKGMVPSTEVLAQRERERERDVRSSRRGAPSRGKPPTGRPGVRDAPRKKQPAPPVLLQRARNPDDRERESAPGLQSSRGRRPEGMRTPRQEEGQGPKVMLLQRPK
ncbi:hypothetical protein NliqN6_6643 [Naganishia liquefaciens]|uniref:PIN domain-containing protein n=1 Tax=Naganishia liquefaciens TaxID=104408 RepID=A0A8H3TYZ3_9TREE|nr:hypothetical protein NliqN6_6643 [Naganishia liquefaciens]